MENNSFINPVGYSEMYEWSQIPAESPYGFFVRMNPEHPDKIDLVRSASQDVLGVTSIQASSTSDDPDNWKYAYLCNEVGDKFLKNERIAIGVKVYDQLNEFSYINTRPYDHYVPVPTQNYHPDQKYVKRSNRKEWVRVNLIGKCIVRDNGECKPGEYCQPATQKGKSKKNIGIAVPAEYDTWGWKFYVTQRITPNTIEIVMSPTLNKYIGK